MYTHACSKPSECKLLTSYSLVNTSACYFLRTDKLLYNHNTIGHHKILIFYIDLI